MKITFNDKESAERAIARYNETLGYPDGRGTDTYCYVPEPTMVDDTEVYEIEITQELNEALVRIATEKLLSDETIPQ